MKGHPDRSSFFHRLLGTMIVIGVIPLSMFLFPVLVLLKLMLYAPFYAAFRFAGANTLIEKLWHKKNAFLLYVHHLIYGVFNFHAIVWWISTPEGSKEADWYGLDVSTYSDYHNYVSSYRNSEVRWRFRAELRRYAQAGIEKTVLDDHSVFYRVLFSKAIYDLVLQSNSRRNRGHGLPALLCLTVRDYYLLLFLPVRVHLYWKDGNVIGLASYLMRGNALIICQGFMADDYTRASLPYEQFNDCLKYAFDNDAVRFVSGSITNGPVKQRCGFYPVDCLMTDEFGVKPFAPMAALGTLPQDG